MPKVKWSKDSIEDLKEICKFIASDSPYYARIFNLDNLKVNKRDL